MENIWTKQYINELQTLVRQTLWDKHGTRNDFEDLQQNAMMRIFAKRSQIPTGQTRLAYIRSLIRNSANDHMRKQIQLQITALEQNSYNQVMDNSDALPLCESLPAPTAECSDPFVIRMVSEAVSSLSLDHQKVLLLKADDFEYKEIASVLKISEGTVRSRLHYARKHCARKLTTKLQ